MVLSVLGIFHRMRQLDSWWRGSLLLTLLAVILYASGAGWGWPSGTGMDQVRPWGHDDVMPLGALAEVQNTFVHPEPNRYLGYPLMQYLVVAAAYVPYLLFLLATGGMSHPGPAYPFGLADAPHAFQMLTLIARGVSVLMGAGIVFAGCQVGKVMWGRRPGWIAGLNILLLYPMFYYSRTGNFDVPYMFWATLGLWAYVLMIRQGFTFRRAAALGACAACAAGTKDQAAAMFLLMPLALMPVHLYRAARKKLLTVRETWTMPVMVVISGLAAYLVASGFIFRPERYFAHVALITRGISFPSYPPTLAGYLALADEVIHLLSDSMGAVMLALSVVGILFSCVKDRLGLTLVVPAVSLLAFFTVPVRFVEMRYLMPVMLVLACYAGYAASVLIAWRRAAIVVLCVSCLVPAMQAVELTHFMLHDARYSAADWLNAHVTADQQIGFFSVGNHLPRLRADLRYVRVDRFAGTRQNVHYTASDIQSMGELLLEKNPEFVVVIPDQSAVPGLPHGLTTPPELYRQLEDGSLGYRRAARFHTPPLFPALRRPDLVDYYEVINPSVDIFVKSSRSSAVEDNSRER